MCDNFGRANLNPSTIFNSNWLLSTSSGSFGIPKIVNQGRLRLTDNTGNNASAATVPGIFPAAGNYISVEFQQYAYNGSGADGIAVTLSDYSVAPTPGAYGGSLGYAQKTGINGFAGGWIGVALDEYGNYENNTEGRSGGTPPCAGLCPDSVGIRGSGSGNAATATNYPWLAGNTRIGNIDPAGTTPGPATCTRSSSTRATTRPARRRPWFRSTATRRRRPARTTRQVVAPFDAYVGESLPGRGAGQLADLVHRLDRRLDQHPRDRQPEDLRPDPDPAHRQLHRGRLQRHRQRAAQHQAERAVRAHLHEGRRTCRSSSTSPRCYPRWAACRRA